MVQLKKKDKLYYARIFNSTRTYEVCELIIRTISDTWFVGIDKKDKHAYIFSYNDIGNNLFFKREEALAKVLNAEENSNDLDNEIFYEEY